MIAEELRLATRPRWSLRLMFVAVACLATPIALAQSEFRRGDVNTDGVVDIGDAIDLGALGFMLFDLPCYEAADVNDDGEFLMTDLGFLLGYLFLGAPEPPPPGPEIPGPDPDPAGGLSCLAYEPVPRAPTGDFRLNFECPIGFFEAPDEPPRAEVFGTLESRCRPGCDPLRLARGWSIGVGIGGTGVQIVAATTKGTVAGGGPPDGLFEGGFEKTEIVDPFLVGDTGPQGPGVVSAVVLSFARPVHLEPVGVERIVKITLEATGDSIPEGRVYFVDGKRGAGRPVDNVILLSFEAATPELGSCDQFRLVEPVGLQIPGDCNQDGKLDISDPICVLGYLFLGTPELLPCGDGSRDATGNVNLLDWHGDGALDISDAVGALRWLTLGGPGHVLADSLNPSACVPVSGCVRGPACDDG